MTAKESKIARMTETPVAERRTTLKMVGGVLAAAIGLAIVEPCRANDGPAPAAHSGGLTHGCA
jgi:hypothetical protein